MFERFNRVYKLIEGEPPAADPRHEWPHGVVRAFRELMTAYPGGGFCEGLYRLHCESSGRIGDELIAHRFPWLKNRVYSFGYSWSGMQVALDRSRRDAKGEPMILLMDPSDGSVFQIDATFENFHEHEIVERPNDAFDSDLFDAWSWANQHALPLKRGQVVGFNIPLSLGGRDEIDNMAVTDFEVEWSLGAQIHDQIRDLPEGTPIKGARVE